MRFYLEITNICNKSCDFCVKTNRKLEFLDAKIFEMRLKKLKSYAREVYIHVLGEPMLHPNFIELINIVEQQEIPLKITSNGSLLNSDIAEALIKNKMLKQINFSLHSLSDEEIEGDILNNILEFTKQLFENKPDCFINYRLWNFCSSDEYKNEKILAKVSDFFNIDTIITEGRRRSKRLLNRLYLNIDKQFNWPSTITEENASTHTKVVCHGGQNQLAILVDGRVVICCLDSEGKVTLGNLDEVNDISDIIHSTRLNKIRAGFCNNVAVEELCKKCTFKDRFL